MTGKGRVLRVIAPVYWDCRHDNPYVPLLCSYLAQEEVEIIPFTPRGVFKDDYDFWHVHWPESMLSSRSLVRALYKAIGNLALFVSARVRGKQIVWTVHNLRPHERLHPRLELAYMQVFVRLVSATTHLTGAGRQLAFQVYPHLRKLPSFVVPHGHYRDVYFTRLSRSEAREVLGVRADARVVAHIGQIRGYKNVPLLISSFRASNDPRRVLLVVGQSKNIELEQRVKEVAEGDSRIHLRLEFIPDSELAIILRAADLVVLPYSDIHNSGSVILALSLGVPVLVPATAALQELRSRVGGEWVRTYLGEFTAEVLNEALLQPRPGHLTPNLEWCSWPVIARATKQAYFAICKAIYGVGLYVDHLGVWNFLLNHSKDIINHF
jgi:glycosyltransferase involved in cell wall biosynthesis